MRVIDLHGKRTEDAEREFHKALGEARLRRTSVEVEFIVGRGTGAIKHTILDLATKHGIYVYVPLSNDGVVVVEFE